MAMSVSPAGVTLLIICATPPANAGHLHPGAAPGQPHARWRPVVTSVLGMADGSRTGRVGSVSSC